MSLLRRPRQGTEHCPQLGMSVQLKAGPWERPLPQTPRPQRWGRSPLFNISCKTSRDGACGYNYPIATATLQKLQNGKSDNVRQILSVSQTWELPWRWGAHKFTITAL